MATNNHSSTKLVKYPKLILFGDSLTEYGFGEGGFFGSHIAHFLQGRCDVVCRGYSGYNTRWCKLVLPSIVNRPMMIDDDVVAVVIFLGANDSVDKLLKPSQHVPVDEFGDNLREMVEYLLSIGLRRNQIILASLPAFDEKKWKKHCEEKGKPFGKFESAGRGYYESCKQVAESCGTEFVDLFQSMLKQPDWKSMLNDGLHFSESGGKFVAEQMLKRIPTDHLRIIHPLWDTIDNDNPRAVLDQWLLEISDKQIINQ
ncbi:isoamyl acetate-hydrolyzing esterase 1 homolog [Tubulanus polymorphus]|uniref:isoamyl acetate-hydrolyzing esterase 1 homolog n=1 Tax=Tubulanus polymorphus TaxID=672921 RepID=UPI003DA682D8